MWVVFGVFGEGFSWSFGAKLWSTYRPANVAVYGHPYTQPRTFAAPVLAKSCHAWASKIYFFLQVKYLPGNLSALSRVYWISIVEKFGRKPELYKPNATITCLVPRVIYVQNNGSRWKYLSAPFTGFGAGQFDGCFMSHIGKINRQTLRAPVISMCTCSTCVCVRAIAVRWLKELFAQFQWNGTTKGQ